MLCEKKQKKKNIDRNLLNLYIVRKYHQTYYRPDNLCLIITGKVDESELLKVLQPVEENIISKGPLPEMERPWFNTGDFANLTSNIEETVLFPDEDESMGTVLIAWNGPRCNVSHVFFYYYYYYYLNLYKCKCLSTTDLLLWVLWLLL